jgi:phosphopantothenoylcysteine decarboxylase/phosphopantothenate--cysteine ligase
MANGIADNLLLTTYLSAKCPVFVAPSMDLDMNAHPATQNNIALLVSRGVHVIDATSGELASGLIGKGRMAEPEYIADCLSSYFVEVDNLSEKDELKGIKVMLTAGPTYEKIDPVRFIGNYSSGKMGYAIAEELAQRGAMVELISGPVKLSIKHANITVTKVESANDMYNACCEIFPTCNVGIMCAAVADYTPAEKADQKIKRKGDMTITLKPTQDIAATMGNMKREEQILAGFALETTDERSNAAGKLERKNLDFIVLNSLNDKGAGFMHDTNKITIIEKTGSVTNYDLKPKTAVAKDIVDKIVEAINAKKLTM